MTDQPPQFSGAIVLKAPTRAEVEALAAQLGWYAEFGDPFSNKYEGGYVIKGQVRAAPLRDADGIAAVTARVASARQESFTGDPAMLVSAGEIEVLLGALRDHAARIGQLEREVQRLELERNLARSSAKQAHQLLQLLSQEEHFRLIERNIVREYSDLGPAAILDADDDSPVRRAFAAQMLELAARTIEEQGPDDVHVTLRAAERCAAIVRGLQPVKKEEQGGKDH